MQYNRVFYFLFVLFYFVNTSKAQINQPFSLFFPQPNFFLLQYKHVNTSTSVLVNTIPAAGTPHAAIFCRLDDKLYKTLKFPVKFRFQAPKSTLSGHLEDYYYWNSQ